jgi:2-amino-4-hydroxy-6-hydroxymethyldihydropteridine diphosphokinase
VERAYIGIGANLGDREATIEQALELLSARPGVELAAVSGLRETEPWGYADQPAFLNAAAAVDTSLAPLDLLAALLAVERELGRTRTGPRYGPRTIDLDLLLYGQHVIEEPGLAVPHPRLQERAFALEPLLDLDPDLTVPGRGRVADLLAALDSSA